MRYQIPTRQSDLDRTLARLAELPREQTGGRRLRLYPAILAVTEQPWGGLLRVEDDDGTGFECGWLSGALGFSDATLLLDDDRVPTPLVRALLDDLRGRP